MRLVKLECSLGACYRIADPRFMDYPDFRHYDEVTERKA